MHSRTPQAEMGRRIAVLSLLLLAMQDGPILRAGQMPACGSIQPALDLVFTSRKLVGTDNAAGACAMSQSVFRKRFKRLMHTSFAKFALSYRIKRVAAQMLGADDSLLTIADDWGFVDAAHLHRSFSRIIGCSPSQYRRQGTLDAGAV